MKTQFGISDPAVTLANLQKKAAWLKSYRRAPAPGGDEARTVNSLVPVDVAAIIAKQLAALGDSKAVEETAKLLGRAKAGEHDAAKTLNGLRIESFNNWALADANRVSWFCEQVTLADTETPAFVNETKNETRISTVAVGVGPLKRYDPVKPQGFELIPLKILTTDEITVQLMDLYNGQDVSNQVQETLDLSLDMADQIEDEIDAFLTAAVGSGGAFGTFTLTGNSYSRIYVPRRRIATGNFPTTNAITVPGATKTTKISTAVIDAIKNYCTGFGKIFQGQPLVPTGRILVASGHANDIFLGEGDIQAPAGTIAQNLLANDWSAFHYAGRDWVIVPDNTLDPAHGVCYPEFTVKPIRLYTKPSRDKDISSAPEDYELAKKNIRKRFAQKVIGAYLNGSMRHAMLQVRYRLPA